MLMSVQRPEGDVASLFVLPLLLCLSLIAVWISYLQLLFSFICLFFYWALSSLFSLIIHLNLLLFAGGPYIDVLGYFGKKNALEQLPLGSEKSLSPKSVAANSEQSQDRRGDDVDLSEKKDSFGDDQTADEWKIRVQEAGDVVGDINTEVSSSCHHFDQNSNFLFTASSYVCGANHHMVNGGLVSHEGAANLLIETSKEELTGRYSQLHRLDLGMRELRNVAIMGNGYHAGDVISLPDDPLAWSVFFDADYLEFWTTQILQKYICAALNSRKFLRLMIGVDKDSLKVHGCTLNDRDRYVIRQTFDFVIRKEFVPPVTSEIASLRFIPIEVDGQNEEKYVVEVTTKPVSRQIYKLSSGRLFFMARSGEIIEIPNMNDVRLEMQKEYEAFVKKRNCYYKASFATCFAIGAVAGFMISKLK